MIVRSTVLFFFGLACAAAWPVGADCSQRGIDRPFGIAMGQPVTTLKQETEFQLRRSKGRLEDRQKKNGAASELDLDREVALATVPKPHPLLSRYSVTATEEAGICSVTGYAPMASINSTDLTIGTLEQQITEVLGPPTVLPGNRSPEVTRIWRAAQGSIKQVALYRFDEAEKRAAVLQFQFANVDDCRVKPPVSANPFK